MKPDRINFHKRSQQLTICFGDDEYHLSAEFLRVHSPSAEVRGHGGQGGELPVGKRDVQILDIQFTGNYALKLTFSDGHDSGLYDWNYLRHLGAEQDRLWQEYLEALNKKGGTRDPLFVSARQLD